MTKQPDCPEAVGFREADDGVDMVLNIGTDHELRMIIPAEAAIEWGRQLMMLGTQLLDRRAQAMVERMCRVKPTSILVDRDLSSLNKRLDS